jgi:hypothetical protein
MAERGLTIRVPRGPRAGLSLALAAAIALALLAVPELAFRTSDLKDRLAREARHTALPPMVDALGRDPDIAFLGDSSVIHGLDTAVVEAVVREETGLELTAVNLGIAGAPPVGHLAWAGRLLAREHRPRVVVMSVAPYMFSTGQSQDNAKEPLWTVMRWRDVGAALRDGLPVEDGLTAAGCDLLDGLRFRRRLLSLIWDRKMPGSAAELGVRGYVAGGRVSWKVQKERAKARTNAPKTLLDPAVPMDLPQFDHLETAIRQLRDAGVAVVLMTGPTASAMWEFFNDRNHYRPIMDRLRDIASRTGATFLDYRKDLVVDDRYFQDGDHMGPGGATRLSVLLAHKGLVPLLGGREAPLARWSPQVPSPGCRVVFDFEEVVPEGWTVQGEAFEPLAGTGPQGDQAQVSGGVGRQMVDTFHALTGEAATGRAVSPSFVLDRPALSLRVGGGKGPASRVDLDVGGAIVRTASGAGNEKLEGVAWDLTPWVGKDARLILVDEGKGPMDHLLLDQVEACGAPGG